MCAEDSRTLSRQTRQNLVASVISSSPAREVGFGSVTTEASGGLQRRAVVDIRGARSRWTGTRLPVELDLGLRELRLILRGFSEHGQREQQLLERICGAEGVRKLRAGEDVTVEIPLAGDAIDFSKVPGLRTAMLVNLRGQPELAVSFRDASSLLRLLRGGAAARRARDAWRAAIAARVSR